MECGSTGKGDFGLTRTDTGDSDWTRTSVESLYISHENGANDAYFHCSPSRRHYPAIQLALSQAAEDFEQLIPGSCSADPRLVYD